MDGAARGTCRELPVAERTSVRSIHGQVSPCNEAQNVVLHVLRTDITDRDGKVVDIVG
jgi:hypothetical protein